MKKIEKKKRQTDEEANEKAGWVGTRAREPANFLAAPAPDFFFNRLRLLIPGDKKNRLRLLTIGLAKYSFPRKLVRYHCKNYKTSK